MLFKNAWMDTLFQGKLTTEHPSSSYGRPVIVNQANLAFGVDEVAYVIPDDEAQAEKVRLAGYRVHTPLSMVIGPDSTQA